MERKKRHHYKVHAFQMKNSKSGSKRHLVDPKRALADANIELVYEPSCGMFIDKNARLEKSVYCASPVIIAK